MITLVDSHCHLDFPELKGDIDNIMERAAKSGVRYMQTICTRVSEFEQVKNVAQPYSNVWCSVGNHPNHTHEEAPITKEVLLDHADDPQVIGIGETGLDFHYDYSPHDLQKEQFLVHIAASRESQLPLIIHSRNADEVTVDMLQQEMQRGTFPALIHCFSTTAILATGALELGLSISFSGILTFKNAKDIQAIAKEVPLDRILVETDAPYLAPVPHRGKVNEPSYTYHTAAFLAELKGISLEEVAETTTENFFRLFNKAQR